MNKGTNYRFKCFFRNMNTGMTSGGVGVNIGIKGKTVTTFISEQLTGILLSGSCYYQNNNSLLSHEANKLMFKHIMDFENL